MKVSIITEGFQSTGYGHITRCLSLYQAFEERNIIPTFYINGDEKSKDFLENSNYKIFNWLNRPTQLISEIRNSDVLIIDSYLASKDFYDAVVKFCNISLFIDDNIRINYPDGIILNGTINAQNFSYPKKKEKNYLLGSEYIPIRKEFWNVEPRKINQAISSILITFGGQDIKNLSIPILKAIKGNYPSAKKYVVLGSADTNTADAEIDDNTEFFYSISAQKMKELMLSSDISITAAGQTLYELAVTGTPSIAVAVADNQKKNIMEWKKSGFLLDTLFAGDINLFKKILDQAETMQSIKVRKKLSAFGKKHVDGQGSRRVINYIIDKYCSGSYFYLRKAVMSDSEKVFKLSNDLSVRSQSINKNMIEPDEHNRWFSEKISADNYIFLLAFDKEDNFIGQVRFQVENSSAVVSISIVHEFRGKGLSKKILKAAGSKVFLETPGITQLIAYILPGNEASIKAFKAIGYVYDKEETLNNQTFLRFTLNREKNDY